ncbi:DUF1127 domain-containing protein [Falsirhodobacter deserti]|uniref:DUF1127 domain-containing protein n=1 Tax=Falsirhodobacter deserti TaxID=1365611 RepID=UPI000FE442E6|nr:DUF1127 domain-containing protein [Falsirhodobacter deserti]
MFSRIHSELEAIEQHQPVRLHPIKRLFLMLAVRRSRRALAELNEDQLQDIGLTEEQRRAEVARRLWDVPPHWRVPPRGL